jgi:cyanoexosortase A
MKSFSNGILRNWSTPQFWLVALAGGLIATHISLSWRQDAEFSQLSLSILAWGAVLSLLWDKHHKLNLESNLFSTVIGSILITFVLLRFALMTSFDSVFSFLPFIAALGLALLASGFKGLRQYWPELLVILILNAPVSFFISRVGILAIYTTKFATAILTYLGVQFYNQGVYIIMANGKAVEVAAGCSGWETMFPLLKLSVLFLVMFPTKLIGKILVPIAAVAVSFVVNGARVAIMAILMGHSTREAFDYWHKGTGSQVFFLISALLFGIFCYFVSKQDEQEKPREFFGS